MSAQQGDGLRRAPGWYPDESMAQTRRYWDGAAWTEHIAPADAPGAPGGRTELASDAVAGGILKGFFLVAAVLLVAVDSLLGTLLLAEEHAGVLVGVALLVVAGALWRMARDPEKQRRPWVWWELAIVAGLAGMVLLGLISTLENRDREEQLERRICETYDAKYDVC